MRKSSVKNNLHKAGSFKDLISKYATVLLSCLPKTAVKAGRIWFSFTEVDLLFSFLSYFGVPCIDSLDFE